MQTARKAVALARCRSVLITLVVLSFVPVMVQRCSMPARAQEQHGKLLPPGGTATSSASLPGTGTPQTSGQITKALADSFPDAVSCPATLVASRPEGPMADSFHKAAARWAGSPSRAITKTYLGQPHPLLTKLLPRVTFTRTQVFIPPEFHGTFEQATMDGRMYQLDGLNRLLLDAGYSFDSTEMPTIAKIAVLFATFGRGRAPTDSTPGDGFPAITFLSVKTGEWQHPIHKDTRRGVLADCVVDGRRMLLFVEFVGKKRPEPEVVYSQSGNFTLLFGVIPGPRLPPLQKRGSLSRDDPSWSLAVVGDHIWTEAEQLGGTAHHFVTVKVDSNSTSDSMGGFRGHNT